MICEPNYLLIQRLLNGEQWWNGSQYIYLRTILEVLVLYLSNSLICYFVLFTPLHLCASTSYFAKSNFTYKLHDQFIRYEALLQIQLLLTWEPLDATTKLNLK